MVYPLGNACRTGCPSGEMVGELGRTERLNQVGADRPRCSNRGKSVDMRVSESRTRVCSETTGPLTLPVRA